MTPQPPLLTLMVGNLDDAVRLGLIDDSAHHAATFRQELIMAWEPNINPDAQRVHFKNYMTKARSRLDADHRPLQAFSPRSRAITTVMPFERFANYFESEVAAPASASDLRSLLNQPASNNVVWGLAQQACLAFTAKFGPLGSYSSAGKQVNAKDIGLHAGRPAWIAPTPRTPARPEAQYWRDRLGLIHLRAVAKPLIDHALVRVEFTCTPSDVPIDRQDWKNFVKAHTKGIWLIRPTVVHEGNQRYVQSHTIDGPSDRARKYGKTRDLNSITHCHAERETLLVCGDEAEMRFQSVELLEGVPDENHGRDNTDETFTRHIGAELGWRPIQQP